LTKPSRNTGKTKAGNIDSKTPNEPWRYDYNLTLNGSTIKLGIREIKRRVSRNGISPYAKNEAIAKNSDTRFMIVAQPNIS